MSKIYDITLTLDKNMIMYPEDPTFEIRSWFSVENNEECNLSEIQMGSHTGTHIDVPRHYFDKGKDIVSIGLNRFIGEVKVFDLRGNQKINAKGLKDLDIEKGDRVIFKTDNEKLLGYNQFSTEYVYLTDDAAEFLVDKGIQLVGIDYFSIEEYQGNGKTHRILLDKEIVILEGIDLRNVEEGIYELIALPLKINSCDGSPVRAILRQ